MARKFGGVVYANVCNLQGAATSVMGVCDAVQNGAIQKVYF